MYAATLHLPGAPTAQQQADLVEQLTDANTRWYLEQWNRGLDPPCCCKCAGVQYAPTGRSTEIEYVGAPELYKRKAGSCRDIAAADCGAKRAKAIRAGMAPQSAAQLYQCVVSGSGGSYHTRYRAPDGDHDPATKIANGQAKPCPSSR